MNFAAAAHELGNWMQAHPWDVATVAVVGFFGVAVITDRIRKNKVEKLNRADIEASDRRLPVVKPVHLPKL